MRNPAPAVRMLSFAVLLACPLVPSASLARWNPAGEPIPILNCSWPTASCLDGAGGLFSFWPELVAGSPPVFLVRGQHLLPDGSDAPGRSPTGRTILGFESNQNAPPSLDVLADGTGGAYLLLRENRFLSQPAPLEHRLFRMSADGTLDPAWPDSGLILGRTAYTGSAELAPDGDGGVFVGLLDELEYQLMVGPSGVRISAIHELRLARATPGGEVAPGWPPEGVLVRGVEPESLKFVPKVSMLTIDDGAGGALLAWADSSGGDPDTRLWRYGPDGLPAGGWPAEGVTFASTPLLAAPALARDDSGGLYVAWNDSAWTVTGGGAPRVQHLVGSGAVAPGWPAGGLEPGPADPAFPWRVTGGLAPDGAGGVYAQWSEISFTTHRGRLTRFASDASRPPGWGPDGLAVEVPGATYPGTSQPVPDLEGGVHMVMGLDPMGTLSDVRISADGGPLPGWWLEAPRTFAVGTGRRGVVLGDGRGAVYVAVTTTSGSPCEALALQLGVREDHVTSVPAHPAGTLALSASPNPSRGPVGLEFTLSRAGEASIEVFEVGGRRVRSWKEALPAGVHHLPWDGRSDDGERVGPGLYFVLVGVGNDTVSRRLAIIR